MFGIVGILLALGLVLYLAYRGISVLLLAPVLALFAALFSLNAPLLGLYTQVFMTATGSFIITYFPLFMLGALFGKLMNDFPARRKRLRSALLKSSAPSTLFWQSSFLALS